VTPDELGEQWQDGKVRLGVRTTWNGKLVGQHLAGDDVLFNFPQLLAHACRTRALRAGALIGAGAVANLDEKKGYACIADRRRRELQSDGIASTPFMLFGDTIRIEMVDANGKSVFGAIEQTVRQAEARKLR
jgi:fumarylacetoacetate (FAA) hydrolase